MFKNKKLNGKQLEAMESIRKWDKNSPLETLIRRINEQIYYEQKAAKRINAKANYIINGDPDLGIDPPSNPTFIRTLRSISIIE